MDFDWDLIVSSFAQQYGIRLYQEYENISCEEFRQLLVGLNSETPLGYAVQIRSEKNPKKIKEMTNQEKKIRSDWQQFKLSQNNKNKQEKIVLSGNDINKILSQIFK